MPVNTTHGLYNARVEQWTRCRDAYNGADAVKSRGVAYLPMLELQDANQYDSYRKRTLWYGATGRTVSGLTGAVTRKDPKIDVPDAMEAHMKDITLGGVPINVFVKDVVSEVLLTGRYGVLVDMATEGAPDQVNTTRPYWVPYTAEQIVNWRTTVLNGQTVLTMVVLAETYEMVKGDDYFYVECGTRYRVLLLEDNKYVVKLYTPMKETTGGWDIQILTPVYRGLPMTEIPFCFIGPCGLGAAPEKPPLLDLVDVNYSHYMSSADLEHGRHFTALPTPWIAGFPKETKLAIGSSIAWVAQDPQAHCGMLEFTGQGLGALEKALESKERLMAVLGARMLEEQKAGVEAAETVMLRSAGERSALQSLALIVSLGLTKVLRWHAMWMGIKDTENINAELNSDFMAQPMSSTELAALMQAWQADAISYETFYWNLQRGELTRPDVTVDEERTLVETQSANKALTLLPMDEDEDEEDKKKEAALLNGNSNFGQ